MLFVLHINHVLVLSFKLDNAVVGRYLSLQDNEFVDCVVADIKQFVNRNRRSRSVLVFPPVNNYRRFLIHKVSEEYSEKLCTFSIGQGHGRRTVVCFKKHIIRELHHTKATDEAVSCAQPVERLGNMGVDRQHFAGQTTSTPCRDNVKRAKAVPAVGIYRPPAARRSEEQVVAPPPRSSSPAVEAKPERVRPARQRRPDIQVYVPRAKRLSTGEQDKPVTSVPCMSSQHSSSPSLRTKGTKHSRTLTVPPQKTGSLTADQVQKNKSSHRLSTSGTESSMHCWNSAPQVKSNSDADSEDTYWTKNTRQSVDNNNQCSDFSLEMSDVEESDIVREEKTQKVSGSSASVNRKDDREVEEPEAAVVERGKRIIQRDSKSSSSSSTPAQSGRNSPTFQDVVGQLWQSSDSKNSSDTSESELVYQEKDIHNSTDICYMEARKEPSNAKHNFSVTSLDTGRVSSPEDFSEHFLDDVDLGRNCRRRHSKSSSSSSTPKHSGRNTPSSVSDNGAQTWDYFSEIKNATNSSQNRVSNCEMDIQNPAECNSVSQECGLSGVSLSEDSGLIMSNAEDSDHFESCSDTIDEIKLVNDDEKFSNVYGDTSFSSSTGSDKLDGSTEKVSSKDIFLSDECRDCKKDNDECRVQEEQNRKNRRIFRGNFKSSDVLIISDPEPVTSTAVQVDSGTEKASSVNGVLNKKKKIRHKGETAASDVTRSPVKVESIEKRKSSPARAPVTLNPDECTWDMMFDDNGDCLDPKLMEELSSSVGSVTIEKPQSDYRSFQSKVEQMMSGEADDEFSHVLEIYNFPAEFKTHDLYAVFSPYITRGFEIKWVDDTHALGVFSSSLVAAEVLAETHPFVKTRPLNQATHDSRLKARRSAEFLQPYRPRPVTCAALARRLVTGALGVKLTTARQEREAEQKLLREAREQKRLAAQQRDKAWEGTIGEK
ncbi:coiled-coil domain-containing protein R3HCC1L [Periplaneta americana]|uniref:coiled-coil domain-containing protein R3HCC1L n=1 Tax=Periplaneta americana TaxID=6978 RepID=UPI0037E7C7BE